MIMDFRFHTLDPVRNQVNWVLRPLEYVSLTPRLLFDWTSNYFTTRGELERENQAIKLRQSELALLATQGF